jgi:hypothetical protein
MCWLPGAPAEYHKCWLLGAPGCSYECDLVHTAGSNAPSSSGHCIMGMGLGTVGLRIV